LRTDHRAFDGSADTWIVTTGDDSVLGIGRYHRGEKLVGLFNFAETQRQVSINELGDYIDICTGEAVDKRAVLLPSGGFRWLLCDFEKGEALP
ncbi:MAG: amylosucrase, partial [Oscillospiraceae bacterium]|nr:amylosucrase [Oscillospiraceae bacterium]